MKKIFLLYIAAGLVTNFLVAQTGVGINTSTPQGPFHIDAKGDTSGTTNVTDDVIVDASGNLGVGTVAPATKVHIETTGTGLRISDDSQGLAYMLISRDATGTGTWVPKPFSVIQGSVLTTGSLGVSGVNSKVSDTSLLLPPGIWMIMGKYATNGKSGGYYYWTYLHDLDDTSSLTADADGNKNKRNQYLTDGTTANPNYYLNASTSFQNALSVVGIYPEQTGGYTTPTTSYIATISSSGKDPGDDGYEHEIVMTFSSSTANSTTLISQLAGMDLGTYFFAIRLDVDVDTL